MTHGVGASTIHPVSKRELQYASGWAAALMALSCLPYLIVWWFTPFGRYFPGLLYNSDDHGVYFAWMRQGADGSLLFRNLFTTEPQTGRYFHAFFLLLGWLSRVPGLDLPLAYHLARVVFGIVTLVLIYRLAAEITPDVFTRRCAFWTTALSSGLGWLFWQDHTDPSRLPVDVWQAEALVPTSLYVNALYAVSLALMLGFVICLLRAEERGWPWALAAGACGLLLGNIHSYDIIHLAGAWSAYVALRWVVTRRFPARAFGMAALAGAVAAPSVAYMAWLYASEPVFKARADTATLSPPLAHYLLGFGLVLPLAAWGAVLLWRRKPAPDTPMRAELLPIAWAVAGFLVAYAPFAFQRKMIMGTHVPLALLAGVAIACLASGVGDRFRLPRFAVAGLVIALLSVTTVRWLVRDTRMALGENLTSTLVHPAYWPQGQIDAFRWLHRNSPREAALLTYPLNGVLAPAYSGRRVWSGHWGETPNFNDTLLPALDFYRGTMSSEQRREFLAQNGIDYVLLSAIEIAAVQQWREGRLQRGEPLPATTPLEQEPFLKPVFTSPADERTGEGPTVLYEVVGD